MTRWTCAGCCWVTPHRSDADRDIAAELLPLLRAGGLLEGWTDDWNAYSRNTYHELRVDALDEVAGACAQNG